MNQLKPEGNLTGMPNTPNNMLRVGVYARKSNRTEGRSRSIEEQVASCPQVATYYGLDFDGATLYKEDEGQKGEWYWRDSERRNPKPWRPELTRLMEDIEAGIIDVVMTWRSDRLYRDAGVCDALMKVVRAKNIRFICGLKDMDIDSATGLFQASVEAANNRKYRDTISEDIRRDHDFKAQLGMFSRNPSCLGYRSKGKGSQAVEVIWEEMELVNRIFRLFVAGEGDIGPMGINGIASLLMNEGVRVARGAKGHIPKHPNMVHTSQIRTILTNCMYVGRWRHKGEHECDRLLVPVSDGSSQLETAVPVALFEAAQEKLKLSDRPGKRSLSDEHLLTGLVICARCGRPLQIRYKRYKETDNGGDRPARKTFMCPHSSPPGYCKPWGIKLVQEPVMDDWVLTQLAPLLSAEIAEMRSAPGREADGQAFADTQRKLQEAKIKETETLTNLIGVFDKEQLGRVAEQLRAERERLQRKADEIQSRLKKQDNLVTELCSDDLASLPKSTIKDALRRVIKWIAVGSEGMVVLTNWGTYIGATFNEIDKGVYFTRDTRRTINIPTPGSALRCLSWLPSPEDFMKGRRSSMGRRSDRLTDEEIVPGLSETGGEPVADAELSIEVIELND